jgi:hypothetical protein
LLVFTLLPLERYQPLLAGIPNAPNSLALTGNALFVGTEDGNIGEYNAATGEAVNANFIAPAGFTYGIASSGNSRFKANLGTSKNVMRTRVRR